MASLVGSAASPSAFPAVEGRGVAALHDPRPVCLVGARDGEGRIGFATIIWATPISHEPPLVAFALRERSHTLGLLREEGRFSLSQLLACPEAADLAEACGSCSGASTDKGALVPHELIDGLPVPLLACSYELCSVEDVRPAGDHLLVTARVESAATRCAERDDRGRLLPFPTLLCVQHGSYGRCEPLS